MYQYNYYLNSELNNVRAYWVKLGYAPVPSLKLDLKYQFEDDDFHQYSSLEIGCKYLFGM